VEVIQCSSLKVNRPFGGTRSIHVLATCLKLLSCISYSSKRWFPFNDHKMLFVILMTRRQLEDDLTDCYCCLTILQPTIQVAVLALAVRSASHTEHTNVEYEHTRSRVHRDKERVTKCNHAMELGLLKKNEDDVASLCDPSCSSTDCRFISLTN
jgi:hypothetical protein